MTTKSRSETASRSDPDVPIWGVEKIAEIAGLTRRAAYHRIARGQIDATRVGVVLVSTRRRVLASLGIQVGQ